MKKWLYILILCQICCLSCFEDETNKDIQALNPIVIENIDLKDNYFSLYMGDTLKIEPLIFCEGIPDAKMSFEWKLFGGAIVPRVIDSTMYCEAKLVLPPDPMPYTLRLTIKDETTGICRIETFSVRILSNFGEGLIVADTKDGANSDLSLVISRLFSSQVAGNDYKMKIFKDIWSESNGSKLDGLVLDAITSVYGSNRSLTVVTTEHLYRADYYDYFNIPEEFDGGMFTLVPPHVGHGYTTGAFSVYTPTGHELMNLNGLITARSPQNNGRKYNYTLYPSGVTDYSIAFMSAPQWMPVYAYDALGKRMLFFEYSRTWQPKEQASGSSFDVCDLGDYEVLFMGEMSQGVTLLVKDTEGRYKGLVMKISSDNISDYAKSVFDFSSAAEIEQAKFFELNKLEDVVYYATETKLYASPTASINAQVQWEVNPGSGEKITGIKIYEWNGGRCDYEGIEDGKPKKLTGISTDRLMLVCTYNESTREGKIHCIPIVNLGVGGLEQNKEFHVELSHFGKILGVYKQKD